MIKVMVGLSAGLLRCGKSCRLRWTNYLRPDLKRGLLSEYEEQMVIDLHAQLGNRFNLLIYFILWYHLLFLLSPVFAQVFWNQLVFSAKSGVVVFCIIIFSTYAPYQMVFYFIFYSSVTEDLVLAKFWKRPSPFSSYFYKCSSLIFLLKHAKFGRILLFQGVNTSAILSWRRFFISVS